MFKIPKKVMGLGGWIRVKLHDNVKTKGSRMAGLWIPVARLIEVDNTMSDREQISTYFHELTHAALYDSGAHNLLTNEQNEALCDLIAMARLREIGL